MRRRAKMMIDRCARKDLVRPRSPRPPRAGMCPALAYSRTRVSEAVLRASDVIKRYRMGKVEVQALRGVNLELCQAELMVLLGPSGSGKSTLLNILGGLDTVTDGLVEHREIDLTHATREELTEYRRRHVGFVFQFYNLI